jgi:hypothetical protein
VKALKQTKRQYQVLYYGIQGQGVLNIYLFGFVSYQFLYSVWRYDGGNNCSPVVLILNKNNKYINVSKSKAQLKLVSG